jgi:hypothetical protein
MLLMACLAHAQTKALPEQGPPPKNLAHQPDGRFSANGDPANPDKFEIYTVKAGDTLSQIAGNVMKNPRLWPQLWEQNEHIVNPHWIYPNDKILIKPVTLLTEAAPPAALAETEPERTPETAPAPEPPRQDQSAVIARLQQQAPVPPRPATVFDLRPRTLAPELKPGDVNCAGFIRPGPILTDMRVSAKYKSDGSALAQQGDYIYISRNLEDAVNPGDLFQVVRPTRHIESFEEGRRADRDLGMHYLDIAQIQVVMTQPDFALARVSSVCDAIELGDIMIPSQKFGVPILPRARPFNPFMKAEGGIKGSVVITKNVLMNFGSAFRASGVIAHSNSEQLAPLEGGVAGTGGIVYLDLGVHSGVKPGDIFIVYRPIEIDSFLYSLPHEAKGIKNARTAIGEVVVLKVDETASSAIVTYSSVGILAGDCVERR